MNTMLKERLTLNSVSAGKSVKILCHHSTGAIRQRLLDLGFVPGASVDLVRKAPLGDPIQCRVAKYNVTLRKTEAALIEVVAD